MRTYNRDSHGRFASKDSSGTESFADMLDEYDKASGEFQTQRSITELNQINKEVQDAIQQGILSANIGEAKNPIPCKVRKPEGHSTDRFRDRDVTDEEAQRYVDNAVLMFAQHSNRNLYISKDGSSVLVSGSGILVTVIPARNFKPPTKYILGQILKVEEFI